MTVAPVGAAPRPTIGPWRRWWVAARPKTLGAAVTPVMIGWAMAAAAGAFALGPASGALAAALLIQIGTNFANDLFDFRRGADTAERLGPQRAVQSGLVTPAEMAVATGAVLGAAAVVGLYLVSVGGLPILWIGASAIAAGIMYTAGPRPLGYLGLGDLFVWLYFGVLAVAGTVYLQTGEWSGGAAVLGAGTGAYAVALLTINNIRDLRTDAKAGKRTLAVRLGDRWSRRYCAAVFTASVVLPVTVMGAAGALVGVVMAPLVWPVASAVLSGTEGDALNPLLGRTVRLQAVHGGLIAAFLLAGA